MMVVWTHGLYDLDEVRASELYLNCHMIWKLRSLPHIPLHIPVAHADEASYDWLEFFAGNAACTTFTRLQGYRGCKFDLKYNPEASPGRSNYMDINSPSGFAPFGGNGMIETCMQFYIEIY